VYLISLKIKQMDKDKKIISKEDIAQLRPLVARLEDNAIREMSYTETMEMAMDELQSLELNTIPSW
jgi:hypothetical protein